jgi:spermidine synthase
MVLPSEKTVLRSLILLYGAGTMVAQVLILRELLVLAQGQELKLALGLWCWLLWTGLGSLTGGRRQGPSGVGPASLSPWLALLGLLLPLTILGSRALPTLMDLPLGQSLPLGTTFLLFLVLLAPFETVSGYFFPTAVRVWATLAPQQAAGRVYGLETLGAALGVVGLEILLMGRVANLSLGLAMGLLLALAPWVLARPQSRPVRLAATVNLLVLAAAVLWAPAVDRASRGWQWPERQVIATLDSPYALLTASREAEQVSFYADNLWQFSDPDPLTAEFQVQLALLEHPRPQQVLLLGGGVAGLGAEILKTVTVTRLDYVELDPFLVGLARDLLPEAARLVRDPRVRLILQDARRFLQTTDQRYDVMIMALPEPRSAQLNRFYTREFFRLAAQRLRPGGVFSFALPGTEISLAPLKAQYLAMTYHTLGQAFPAVMVFPGGQVRFFASNRPGVLAADPELLVQRLQARQLSLTYVREYYLLQDLSPGRQQYLAQVLAQPPPEINTDLTPRCYFYDLAMSAAQEGRGIKELLLALQSLPAVVPGAALILATTLAALVMRRRPGLAALYQVGVMGLGTMSLEVLVLVLYQISLGSLYQQLGLLIAAFMAGMAAGSAMGARWGGQGYRVSRRLAALQGGLALLAGGLALWLQGGGAATGWEGWRGAGYALVLIAAGFGGGGVFALSAARWAAHRPGVGGQGGMLYAADLLGATVGTLGVGLVVLPVWGIVPSLGVVACLHVGAGLLALLSIKG